jgi:NADH dehydrogenase FAD-containing subunit
MPGQRPKVVIVGAGFGGLEAAKTLRRAPADVVVIDRNDLAPLSPFRSWLGCITNTSGYDFRKGQVPRGRHF